MAKKKTTKSYRRPKPKGPVATFPAIRGIQACREYYGIMMRLGDLKRMLTTREEEENLSAELTSQRILNKARANKLARYVQQNRRDYILPPLVCSADGVMEFKPISDEEYHLGLLTIELDARIMVNDGQHRRAGVIVAVADAPELGDEHIMVQLFWDAGLKRSQQMFTDLNANAVKVPRSLTVLYDHRNEVAEIARQLAKDVDVWRGLIEMEKPNVGGKSLALHSLNNLYDAVRVMVENVDARKLPLKKTYEEILQFWKLVGGSMLQWRDVRSRRKLASEMRMKYVNCHGVFLSVLARVYGHNWNRPDEVKKSLDTLGKIQYARDHSQWLHRLVIAGRVVKSQVGIRLAANVVKRKLGYTLFVTDNEYEEKMDKVPF